ncbi:MAG: lipid-A-disaccharide synthase-related protein [Thermosynechococcaceae cyanobacterium]
MKLLALSNGHGEDVVAVRILRQLRQQCPDWDLQAMPIVGEGRAYRQTNIKLYGPVCGALPSGGFIYMDQRQLFQDLRSGLLPLTGAQLKACRQWAATGGAVLAVGDIVPLLFAWHSGAPYAFVGTAKSEYYLRSDESAFEGGRSPRWPWQRWFNSDYLPWERSLMQHRRCRAVFPRDRLTAQGLGQWPIPVVDAGNPMMDDLMPSGKLPRDLLPAAAPVVLLLPGSRSPEAYRNWQQILEGITPLAAQSQPLVLIAAIDAALDLAVLQEKTVAAGWHEQPNADLAVPHCRLQHQQTQLLMAQQVFNDGLHLADLAIAMAGTATEQCVGLGLPVVTLAGSGPQFTWAFAEAQSRLLGPSIHLLERPDQVPNTVVNLLQDSTDRDLYRHNGQQRMGQPGAAARIASVLKTRLTHEAPTATGRLV